jgi:hypothetical protein
VRLLLCLVFSFAGGISVRPARSAPVNEFTFVPEFGAFTDLRGRVLNVNPADYRVTVFIFLPGLGWHTKPTCSNPLTTIGADGTWTADITTGGIDQQTTMIAAYVMPRTFSRPCVTAAECLPAELDRQVVAVARVSRVDPRLRSCASPALTSEIEHRQGSARAEFFWRRQTMFGPTNKTASTCGSATTAADGSAPRSFRIGRLVLASMFLKWSHRLA